MMRVSLTIQDAIVKKRIPVQFLDKSHTVAVPVQIKVNGFYSDTYYKERKKFIKFCLDKKMTYEEIGCLLGITRARVYQIHRYDSRMSKITRDEVLKRDKNRCRICGAKSNLHIHHLENPRSHAANNLMTLCAKCH